MAAEKVKVVPQKLSPEAFHALENVVGKEWVSEERSIIETYVVHCIDIGVALAVAGKSPRVRPAAVVLPATTEEVQGVVRVANRYGFPIVAFSNAQLGSGCTVPGTVVVSLSRMDKIQIHEENMSLTIEPYIDYGILHHEASRKGLWLGGSGWHGAIAKPCSQVSTGGIWQSDLKFSGLTRNLIGAKVVLADGSLLRLGSAAIAGTGETAFTENMPGPNLWGMFRQALGARGIVTELTLKLHPWVGGYPFPEDRGRPSIEHYFEEAREKTFDRPPFHPRHKVLWFEHPTVAAITEATARMASSGVGIALNITGNYNSMMCSYSIEEANQRSKEYFGITGYIVLAGVSSEKQLAYEEKVVKQIVDETGGKLLSADYKPELLDALAPWNVEYVLNTETGMRTVRSGYIPLSLPPYGTFDEMTDGMEIWEDVGKDVGFIGEDKGEYFSRMCGDCPYGYIVDRGHNITIEMDQFPERASRAELIKFFDGNFYGFARFMASGYPGSWFADFGEPFLSVFPEIGPDSYLMVRMLRKITNPNNILVPGRAAWTDEEFKASMQNPSKTMETMLHWREHFGFPKLELDEDGVRWKPVE